MTRNVRRPLLLVLMLVLIGPAYAQGAEINWSKDLSTALAKGKETDRIVMICVNAKHVQGREGEEPAAKGLREVVYRDPRVVKESRDFVCVMMTPKSSTADHGILGNLGVVGEIVSPQHIFVSPAGDRVLLRKQYWSHGKGKAAVDALLSMMEKAKENAGTPPAPAKPTGKAEAAPADAAARADWIARMLEQLSAGVAERDAALRALIKADRDGDCTRPLIGLLSETKKDVSLLRALIRALGRDGLEDAALPIAAHLKHRKPEVRGDAAVSLEYIGSREKKVVAALMGAAGKQKDETIANHMYRALGRCGVTDGKVRALLLKKTAGARSQFASFGPAIGLAYFEGDAKAARGVEKLLKQMGIPGGGPGGAQNTVKRALLCWSLASIEDGKSGKFMREEMIAKLANVKAFWVDGVKGFWEGVAAKCDGDETAMAGVEAGVRVTVGFAKRWNPGQYGQMDEHREERDNSKFTPKGDRILESEGGG